MEYIYLHLLVLRAPALVWNYPKERFTFDRMKRKSGSVRFCRKGWRSWAVPSEWQLNPSDCLFFRGNFSLSHTIQRLLVKACLISRSMIVYMCLCVRKCHCLNLHGDDVPFSPAPAGIRGRRGGGEEAGGQSLKQRRKNIRCSWCSEKNQTSEEHSAQFTFLDHLRCSIQSEHSNHGNSCWH